jgi:hypothetical protein
MPFISRALVRNARSHRAISDEAIDGISEILASISTHELTELPRPIIDKIIEMSSLVGKYRHLTKALDRMGIDDLGDTRKRLLRRASR